MPDEHINVACHRLNINKKIRLINSLIWPFPFLVPLRFFLPGAVFRGWFLPFSGLAVPILLLVSNPCAVPSVPPLVVCPVAALPCF
ncbi:hypothetical protein IEQ34_012165 [Dendrobium chrysotoxum]|uniref:Uncharacterized protein n=1 Tax=Dendrobium chrysotoxum TaxID=161865 RepID=A0AAV7GTM7_DENCH|nr:hypothetical protein IEQ34_012165 [Dendrobium chrysotoxum]